MRNRRAEFLRVSVAFTKTTISDHDSLCVLDRDSPWFRFVFFFFFSFYGKILNVHRESCKCGKKRNREYRSERKSKEFSGQKN